MGNSQTTFIASIVEEEVVRVPGDLYTRDRMESLGFVLRKRGRELGEYDSYFLPHGFTSREVEGVLEVIDPSGRVRYRYHHPTNEEACRMSLAELKSSTRIEVLE